MTNLRVKLQDKLELGTRKEQHLKHKGRLYCVCLNFNSFTIRDITDAGLRGKSCHELRLRSEHESPNCAFWNELLAEHTLRLLEATTEQVLPVELFKPYFQFYLGKEEAIRVMPLDLSIIKPLKEEPKKWTVPHAIRALVNGQYENLKKNGYYTDDYAHDNSVNFGRGIIADAVDFAQDIMRNPSGWRTSKHRETGIVSICCYSFDLNEFTPKIGKPDKPSKPTSDKLKKRKGKKEQSKKSQASQTNKNPKAESEGVATNMTLDEAKEILRREGLQVTETMTTPKRAGKKPRPVWQVSGRTNGLEHFFYELGCSKRQWKGAFSFWNEDPSLEIAQAIKVNGQLSKESPFSSNEGQKEAKTKESLKFLQQATDEEIEMAIKSIVKEKMRRSKNENV